MPFFADSVRYESDVTVPPSASGLRVEIPDWQGSVMEVLLDGKRQGQMAWQPFSIEMAASPGRHTVTVRVVATPRNLFGPYHNPSKPRMRAWPAAWAEFPEHQPAGSDYDLFDYGLMRAPVVSVTSDNKL
jgi:hypothetical protein